MTRYFLNAQEIAVPGDISSLDQILKRVETTQLSPDEAIGRIQVDGHSLTPDSLEDAGAIFGELGNRRKVEIFTASILEVSRDAICEAIDYVNRAESLTHSLASSFKTTPEPESLRSVRQLRDGFYWLSLLLDKLAANFKIPLENCKVQGASAQGHLGKFADVLKRLADAQERGDFIMISELLEHEIRGTIPVWKSLFGLFLNEVDRASRDCGKSVK